MKPRIIITRQIFPDQVERLRRIADVLDNQVGATLDSETLRQRFAQADAALISVFDPITAEVIASSPRLKFISNIGVGTDHIDLDACRHAGIAVSATLGVVDAPTADLAFALLLAVARRVCEADAYVRAGAWTAPISPIMGLDIHHRKLGIVGFGRIGKQLARRATGFDMDVLYTQRNRASEADEQAFHARYVDLDTLLGECDFVVLQVPYSEQTHHLIGERELALMKKNAILINTARGGVLDDRALAGALSVGQIAGAGLDVVEGEPHLAPELLACPNLVLMPHLGSATLATRQAMVTMAVDHLIQHLESKQEQL